MMDVEDGNGEQLVCVVRSGDDVLGYIVVDSTVQDRARGGLRMLPDVSEREIRGLARAMTLKYGFLGLPQGGAKAGVRGDPDAPVEERRARLGEFARLAAPILRSGIFTPDTDMGTTRADIDHVLSVAGVGVPSHRAPTGRSGYYTALTVFAAARAGAHAAGLQLANCRVAVEGFGSVGSALAQLLHSAGARVVAVSTSAGALYAEQGLDVPRLASLASVAGSQVVDNYPDAERIDRAALIALPVDVLCPCARHDSVRAANVATVRARVIAPGANDPLTRDAERELTDRGVCCIPDFVANCGGVLGGTMEFAGVDERRIAAFIADHYASRIAWLLAESYSAGESPRTFAERIALASRARMNGVRGRRTPASAILDAGLALYRRGWIPTAIVGRLSVPYFRRAMA